MSELIHPTAIIDPGARLGADVRVGPYAIIEKGCVVDDRCEILAHAVLCADTVLGAENQIGYGAVIGGKPQDNKFKGGYSRVEIGARNRIREHVTIHRASEEGGTTVVGDDNFLMSGVHLGHDVVIGNRAILANNSLLGGYTQVGDAAFLGGGTLSHQFVRIGRLAITHGGAILTRDLPPYFMAAGTSRVDGINRVGLRRANVKPEVRRAIQKAFDMIYRSGLNVTQALEKLRGEFSLPEIDHLIEFIRGSKRGICRLGKRRRDEEEE